MKSYNPYAIRRCVRRETEAGSIQVFVSKSFTKDEGEYHPSIDTLNGDMICDCPDWVYRKSKTGEMCKHLQRAAANIERARKRELK
ncbi:MAG: hypothetical protein WCL39_02790 [Armatimonadota bacterium]